MAATELFVATSPSWMMTSDDVYSTNNNTHSTGNITVVDSRLAVSTTVMQLMSSNDDAYLESLLHDMDICTIVSATVGLFAGK